MGAEPPEASDLAAGEGLPGDREAAKMFVGDDCSLCTNPNWDTMSKRLD